MFVVLEFGQAGGVRVYDTDVHDTAEDAEETAAYAREQLLASGSGRQETYEVADVTYRSRLES